MYLYYAQTPELRTLATSAERDSVHAQAWRRLRRQQPRLWLRSFLLIMLFVFSGGAAAESLGGLSLSASPQSMATLGAFIGGVIGALLRVHTMATSLRPVYAEVIAQRQETKA